MKHPVPRPGPGADGYSKARPGSPPSCPPREQALGWLSHWRGPQLLLPPQALSLVLISLGATWDRPPEDTEDKCDLSGARTPLQ